MGEGCLAILSLLRFFGLGDLVFLVSLHTRTLGFLACSHVCFNVALIFILQVHGAVKISSHQTSAPFCLLYIWLCLYIVGSIVRK